MVGIGKLAAGSGAGRYYVEQVARGAEDYYAASGEAPGDWLGAGASTLGLTGEVSETGITRLLESKDPATGMQMRRPAAGDAVAGFDLAFRAPKSVSVLFGIADDAVVGELRAAHAAAVRQALGYMERHACIVRRGAGGRMHLPGGGFVGAAFEHRSSRAGDPLLHTHVVVANAALGPDGRWSALHGQALYRHAKTAGYLYQAALRAQVAERLGLDWGPVVNGTADLRAVPRPVVEHFSVRRREILEHMAARGEHSARAAQIATLETRRAKVRDFPLGRLRAQWRARAAEHGLSSWRVEWALHHARRATVVPLEFDRIARRLEGPHGLTAHRSTFTRRDVLQAFAEAAQTGAPVGEVERLADQFFKRSTVTGLDPVAGERQFSTHELLDVEAAALDLAAELRAATTVVASAAAVDAALGRRPTLSKEQRAMVIALTRSGRGIEVVVAPAGAGKTFALDAAREAWQASGVPVLGCALSARAACELRDQAGIDATTIASLTLGFDRGMTLARGSVLVVDEAGMVGTRDLARLADAVAAANGKLVLVGDDHQLPEIQAGGLFSALADQTTAIELHEVRRQHAQWDRDALTALRDGDTDRFARDYQAHGRIVATPTAARAREQLVDDWLDSYRAGERAVMIANRRSDVADLNTRAREHLHAHGDLGHDELVNDHAAFATGDRVIARRNDKRLGIVNGDLGHIIRLHDEAIDIELDRGRSIQLPRSYAAAGQLQHGYALTAHLAQGSTVDRSFVLGSDELYREWGYTALTRHRATARFYISATPTFLNRSQPALQTAADAQAAVARLLNNSRAEHLALDRLGVAEQRAALSRQRTPDLNPASDPLERLRHQRERSPGLGREL